MHKTHRLLVSLALSLVIAAAATAQTPRRFPFRADHYDVQVLIHPEDQTISGLARVDFIANEVSRTVVVELHQDLKLNSIHVPGSKKPLEFERDRTYPLLLTVGLPDAVGPGQPVSLEFDYTGPISSEDDSPTKGVRFASIDKTSAYLLLPARWFPLTNYPANRYTGTFKIITPDTMYVTGTGKADPPTMQPGIGKGAGQASYVFHCDHPGPVGTFVAGALQLNPVQTEGISVSVFTPPVQASTATAYGNSLAHIILYYSDAFGQLQEKEPPPLTIAQMPDGSLSGYSAPGLLLISARQWTTKANDRLLSQLASQQWWGDRVLPLTSSDTWLTDGLSRYAEAMYAEQSDGSAGLHRALEDFAVGALMYEDTAPISQAGRLQTFSNEYRSVVADKGALVFHMLRTEIGDDDFNALLHEFYKKYEGKNATIADFEKMAYTKVPTPKKGEPPVNLVSFFSQWVNSTGIPEFKLEFIVYRTKKGFKVVGKIHQDLDTFRMPVELRVDTEGNPEYKKILVTGTTQQFEIDTFGRPKPYGIVIDPNNNLLKSSARLRIRAFVARGEGFAENGQYYEAIQEYQHALDLQSSNSLAHFRMGEAMFNQKNYQSAANAFRAALGGDLDPKWVDVWSHIYIGKIYDILGQRERAVNEYSLAQHLQDDTAGAQEEAGKYLQRPYTGDAAADAQPAPASAKPAATANGSADADPNKPVLKKRP
ncbi:MAG TPA: M1 family aminopeptidase [Candidatus Acidoferrales bacterium]|nr:M1 family aminopeptidase [Candidatus Acidoferrales bacterium]